jgi:hypothetical protein
MTVKELIQNLQDNYKGNETIFVQWVDAGHNGHGMKEKDWAKIVAKLEDDGQLVDTISTAIFEAVDNVKEDLGIS